MVFETIKNAAASVKESAKEKVSRAVEKVKDAGSEIADSEILKKVTGVAKEWKNDLVDSIKLKTMDKWKMNLGRGKENWLLKRKEGDITKTGEKISKLDSKISEKGESKKAEEAKFNEAAEKIADPALKKFFESGKLNKGKEFDDKVSELKSEKTIFEKRRTKFEGEKSGYEKNIKDIENKMTGRIDEKINGVKEKYGLKDKLEKQISLKDGVASARKKADELGGKLGEYKEVLKLKKMLTKEDQKRLKGMTDAIEKELAKKKKNLSRLEKAQGKIDRQVGKVNKKVKKWEDLKGKYGLVKKEASANQGAAGGATKEYIEKEVAAGFGDESNGEQEIEEKEEKIIKIVDEINKACEGTDVKKLKENIPTVKKKLEELGAKEKGHPLQAAYEAIQKNVANDEEVKANAAFVKKAVERYKGLL